MRQSYVECRRDDLPCLTTVPKLWGLFQITHNDFEVQGHPAVTLIFCLHMVTYMSSFYPFT